MEGYILLTEHNRVLDCSIVLFVLGNLVHFKTIERPANNPCDPHVHLYFKYVKMLLNWNGDMNKSLLRLKHQLSFWYASFISFNLSLYLLISRF